MATPEMISSDDDPESDTGQPQPTVAAITPYEELSQLHSYGPIQYNWLIGQIQQVARANGFPPPEGNYWTDDLATSWLHDQLAGARGTEFIVGAYAKVTDDQSYRLYARRALKNAFIDEARATPVGRLRMRMQGLLAGEPDFVDFTSSYAGTHAWTLVGLDLIWEGDYKDLLKAPGLLSIGRIAKLNPAGPTSAENKAKLVGAARTILEFAQGALTAQVLAIALVDLFELDDLGTFGFDELNVEPSFEIDHAGLERAMDLDRGWARPNEYMAPADWIAILDKADQVLDGFTREEMVAVGLADHPVETLAEMLPGVQDAAELHTAALTKFKQRCTDLDVSGEVRAVAASRCSDEVDR